MGSTRQPPLVKQEEMLYRHRYIYPTVAKGAGRAARGELSFDMHGSGSARVGIFHNRMTHVPGTGWWVVLL